MRSKGLRFLVFAGISILVVTLSAFLGFAITSAETGVNRETKKDEKIRVSNNVYDGSYNKNNLIRFHVIANSDSERDQALKRKVRDLIVQKMSPEFEKAKNLNDARRIAKEHLQEISGMVKEEVIRWGEEYAVRAEMGKFDFPVKTYGELTLPAGKYEAIRVVIGQGQGANWWCVLFPPLCFVDVSKAMGPADDEVIASGRVQRPRPNFAGDNSNPEIKIRYKLLDILGWSRN